MLPRIMIREDPEVSALVKKRFEAEGIRVLTEHKASRFRLEGGEKVLLAEHGGQEVRIPFDAVIVAVGRIANTQGYGLEELGIGTTKARTVETDDYLQTIYPNILRVRRRGRSVPVHAHRLRTRRGTRPSTGSSGRSAASRPTTA